MLGGGVLRSDLGGSPSLTFEVCVAISSVSLRRIGDGVLRSGLRAGILCSISVLLEAGGVGRGLVLVLGLLVMVDTEFLVDNESVAPEACGGAL